MARLFRSKSCSISRNPIAAVDSLPFSPPAIRYTDSVRRRQREEEEFEEAEDLDEEEEDEDYGSPVTTPFIGHEERKLRTQNAQEYRNQQQFPIVAVLLAALRKSLVTCSVERDDVANLDIGWPTDVRHVSHVTFDPFNGFLGLPVELQPHVPRKVPSASVRVFGVSAQSMQCSYDNRGNSVPTILLMMQSHLYSEGGLRAEGIFRINGENSKEEHVRSHLNKGVVPCGTDVHCLAGLIKAWFRELPAGVLDSLTPEQVMHCNTEEECTQLVSSLPATEAALLYWAINLMADVVQYEHYNKMNARNIAMVFAPNMTQMADPLTALIHAVQVMNLLKTLILKTLRERAESAAIIEWISTSDCPASVYGEMCQQSPHCPPTGTDSFCTGATLDRLESNAGESCGFSINEDANMESHTVPTMASPVLQKGQTLESSFQDECDNNEGKLTKLSLRKGMEKLCRHPVFQLSKSVKKNAAVGFVNDRQSRETWI